MIKIRPGRSWRLNPAYLGTLRSLGGQRAEGFNGGEILDVLGIEVDGVDIAAGVGEAEVLVAVDDLAQALLLLGEGQAAAQATIGPGPTELVLENRGPDLLLTLVSLAPPARVLASGLLVDTRKLRAAALHAARGLLLDLFAISPALEDTPLARRLGEACAHLARRPEAAAKPWPSRKASAASTKLGARPSLELWLTPEATARLRARGEVSAAPLAPHLGEGRLSLRRPGAAGLQCEGPLLLLLRNLLDDAEALAAAWEAGDRSATLRLGPHELRCDLSEDQLRAPGWRGPLAIEPLKLASLFAEAALAYAQLAGRGPPNEYLSDLRDKAHALFRHCRDLLSGDLRREPGAAAPARDPRPAVVPLSPGRMRRLVYREAFRVPAAGALRALLFESGPVVLERPQALEALDARTGEKLWTAEALPGAVARQGDLFYSEPGDALVRLDVHTGDPRWKRRLRGAAHPAQLWACERGVLRALPGEGICMVSDAGALAFRARLPGGAPELLASSEGLAAAALQGGALCGLDLSDGGVLWKRKQRALWLSFHGPRLLLLGPGRLSCLEAATGEPVWEHDVPEDAGAPVLCDGHLVLLAQGKLFGWPLAGGLPRAPAELPWARLLISDEADGALFATGEAGAAARLDSRGTVRWELPSDQKDAAALPQLQRGVILLRRGGLALHGLADGLLLAKLPPARFAALGADLTVASLDGDSLSVSRLSTHLAVL